MDVLQIPADTGNQISEVGQHIFPCKAYMYLVSDSGFRSWFRESHASRDLVTVIYSFLIIDM